MNAFTEQNTFSRSTQENMDMEGFLNAIREALMPPTFEQSESETNSLESGSSSSSSEEKAAGKPGRGKGRGKGHGKGQDLRIRSYPPIAGYPGEINYPLGRWF